MANARRVLIVSHAYLAPANRGKLRALAARGRPGETYNICSGTALTMAEGLRILVAAATVPIVVRRDPSRDRPSDTPWLVGDNRKLCAQTGWRPERSVASALLDLLNEARKEFA